ncbi:MAG: glycosyltransferase family 2 protein [Planctomycetia bacterium]
MGSQRLTKCTPVLAVVTHYRCEEWLEQCLESLVGQSMSLAGVVVVDDASPHPPLDIVRRFPSVTLMRSTENVGMYRLLQAIVDATDYPGYMFQDADDWSAANRLAVLLAEAEETGAELVGCQPNTIFCGLPEEPEAEYPRDVNAAVLANPIHHLLLPSSVMTRDLIVRLGGFATGLRYGGDSEFLRRAIFVATVRNVPERCYFRRVHPQAATRRPESGYESPMRQALAAQLRERAWENIRRLAVGDAPDLSPFMVAEPVKLEYIGGPELKRERVPPLGPPSCSH